MALASPEMRGILAANSSQARLFSSLSDSDREAALSILVETAQKRGNDIAGNNDDHDREAVLAMVLNSAAALVQVIHQPQGGGCHNLLSIIAFVVSLLGYLGYKYFYRTHISAARGCRNVASFSASRAMASLLAMPLHGIILKCIPYAICVFPLVSLLSCFSSCLKGSPDNPPTSANAADFPSSSLPSPSASTGSNPLCRYCEPERFYPLRLLARKGYLDKHPASLTMNITQDGYMDYRAVPTVPHSDDKASVADKAIRCKKITRLR